MKRRPVIDWTLFPFATCDNYTIAGKVNKHYKLEGDWAISEAAVAKARCRLGVRGPQPPKIREPAPVE